MKMNVYEKLSKGRLDKTLSESSRVSSRVSDRVSNGQTDRHIDGHSDRLTDTLKHEQTIEQSDEQPILTKNQSLVLQYLFQIKPKLTKYNDISKNTGVAYGTVRHIIRVLQEEGFISRPKKIRMRNFQGFSFHVDEIKCQKYFGQSKEQSNGHTVGQSKNESVHQSVKNPSSSSSSLNINNYFSELGLTVKTVRKWSQEFGISTETIVEYLNFAEWDFAKKEIEKPIAYFYTTLKKAGSYPKPKGYKSPQEIRLEKEKEILNEKKKHLDEINKIREEILDTEFEIFMTEKGEEYEKLKKEVPKFAQSEKLFKKEMKRLYRERREKS